MKVGYSRLVLIAQVSVTFLPALGKGFDIRQMFFGNFETKDYPFRAVTMAEVPQVSDRIRISEKSYSSR